MRYDYVDFYGCRATITVYPNGSAEMQVYTPDGHKFLDRSYKNFRGARSALGRYSDGTAKMTDSVAFIPNKKTAK